MIGASGFELTTEDGDYTMAQPAPGVLYQRVRGRGSEEIARTMIARSDAVFRLHDRVSMFSDFSEMTNYATGARIALTTWTKERLPQIEAMHILVRSKLVAMGVSVANVALRGGIVSHTNRVTFDRALQKVLEKA